MRRLAAASVPLTAEGRYRSGQTGQTVNLLALRLRWFESSPAHFPDWQFSDVAFFWHAMSIFGELWLLSVWRSIACAISQVFFSRLCPAKLFLSGVAAQL